MLISWIILTLLLFQFIFLMKFFILQFSFPKETLSLLKQQHAQLAAEKDQIQNELEQRGQVRMRAQERGSK